MGGAITMTRLQAWALLAGVALAAPPWAGPAQPAHQAALTFDDFPGGEALACQVAICSRIGTRSRPRGSLRSPS